MFENIMNFLKKLINKQDAASNSKDTAKERLHLVLMQDRANVSADFLDLMRQEIIDVIKKYIEVDESAIDVRLTNKENEDGTKGAPALYANIPIVNIKEEAKNNKNNKKEENTSKEEKAEESKKEEIKKEEQSKQEVKKEAPKTDLKEENSKETESTDNKNKEGNKDNTQKNEEKPKTEEKEEKKDVDSKARQEDKKE